MVTGQCGWVAERLESRVLLAAEPTIAHAGFRLFTDGALATAGLIGSYINKNLRTYSAQNDWRVTQTVAGTRVDRAINFTSTDWGNRAALKLTGGTDADWDGFSVQWDGYVQVLMDGLPLATRSDDSSRMWIDINGNGTFNTSGNEFINNHWGSAQGTTTGPASAQLASGVYKIRLQYEEGNGGNVMQLLAATPMVRVGYVIPSNRTPQPRGVAGLQQLMPLVQNWYRDQMERTGFGRKTFVYETEEDGLTPKIHVVNVSETDDYLRGDIWGRVGTAASNAGVPTWTDGQVWLLVPECHIEKPDGKVEGGTALGASWGSGIDPGLAMIGSNGLAVMKPGDLTDNRTYANRVIPEVGPYPLKQDVSFAWFEGNTISSLSSSYHGASLHEMSHGFGMPHDFRNDENFHGVLMGNGLRGFRGAAYPEQYPTDDMFLSYGQAMALSTSRYFNGGAFPTDRTQPSVSVSTSGSVAPVDGALPIQFTASDSQGLASAMLTRNGEQIGEMALSGASASKTFSTAYYTPGQADKYAVAVYDTLGNKRSVEVTITPTAGVNRAPQPFVRLNTSTLGLGKTLTMDASRSADPDGNVSAMKVEWDLDGDGVFDTSPSTSKVLSRVFSHAGARLIQARLTDAAGALTLSAPIGIRIVPTVAGTTGTNTYYLRTDPANSSQLQIFQSSGPSGTPTFTMLRTDSRALVFNAGAGNDQVIVDFDSGSPVPDTGMVFDGGSGTSDQVRVKSPEVDGISATASQLRIGSAMVSLSGVEKQVLEFGWLRVDPAAGVSELAAGANKLLRLGKLTINAGGTLDLGDNRMVINGGDLGAITLLVASGRKGGTWAGTGITSSSARDDARHMTALGVAANDKGGGVLLDPAEDAMAILVKYTWSGDANIDGVVNADDYFQIDSGFISQKQGWYNGDFNYDGVINADDYFEIDQAFIGQTGPLSVDEPQAVDLQGMMQSQFAKRPSAESVLGQLFSAEPVL